MKFLSFLCWLFSISAIINALSGQNMWNEQPATAGWIIGDIAFACLFVGLGMAFWSAAGRPE
jgi:hypothetical protein